jgi:hypothetical protein
MAGRGVKYSRNPTRIIYNKRFIYPSQKHTSMKNTVTKDAMGW